VQVQVVELFSVHTTKAIWSRPWLPYDTNFLNLFNEVFAFNLSAKTAQLLIFIGDKNTKIKLSKIMRVPCLAGYVFEIKCDGNITGNFFFLPVLFFSRFLKFIFYPTSITTSRH
jgi:hypothetical protein